jgi:hypothetical protein
LRSLVATSFLSQETKESEAGWNDKIHSKILDLALRLVQGPVESINITHAAILSPFRPPIQNIESIDVGDVSDTISIRSGTTNDTATTQVPKARGKMVDYALALCPGEPDLREHIDFKDPLDDHYKENERLRRSIEDMIGRGQKYLMKHEQTFHQSTFEPLRLNPARSFIETKLATGSIDEGLLQLSIWVAAWYYRMHCFTQLGVLPALPLIICVEHA